MKYHEIDMVGKFFVEEVSSNPAWVAADERRFIYNSTDKTLYYGGDASWLEVAAGAVGGSGDLSNYALIASDNAWSAHQTPVGGSTYNLGSVGATWLNVYADNIVGTATEATYADVAEIYKTPEELPVGTVVTVAWQGDDDVEVVPTMGMTDDVIGVVSENPAYLMNKDGEGQAVGLIGKLPIRVTGKVKKGEALCSSDNGTASKYLGLENGSGYKFAYALENKDTKDEATIMCLLRK
jgi:hypothetical protein